jgi:glycosyltransferase involved in cell wall biosynthesis
MNSRSEHICVCVCTYRRPKLLRRLLEGVEKQSTGGLFTYSVVIVDNDRLRSAEDLVSDFAASSDLSIRYCVEPVQNIAMARNRAVENACGDYVAFIDDDEFPAENWLLVLYEACKQYAVDGVLGSVEPHFDDKPPMWILLGKFWQRRTYPTGTSVKRGGGRTGNVLLKRGVFPPGEVPFRPQFCAGEDKDFFTRMIEAGHGFVWCKEAVVYEVVPPERWKRSYIVRRSLFQGSFTPLGRTFRMSHLAVSVIAIPVYAATLPLAVIVGHQYFMSLLVKLAYHSGRVLACMGIRLIKTPYITG